MYHDGPVTVVDFGAGGRTYPNGTAVFRLPNGNVVVINSTFSSSAGGTSSSGTFGLYDADTGTLLANGVIGSTLPSISAAGSGFAIASGTANYSFTYWGPTYLSVRIYGEDGSLLQTTQIAQSDTQDTFASDLTTLNDGSLAVVWTGLRDPLVFVQRLDANGAKLGGPIQIGTENSVDYFAGTPTIAALSDGGYVTSWVTKTSTSDTAIVGRKFDADGNAVGSQFTISQAGYVTGSPELAALPGGGFVVVWTKTTNGGADSAVDAQIFGANAAPIAPAFSVAGGPATSPEVAADADGNFVVVFLDSSLSGGNATGSGGQAYAQAYSATGANLGSLLLVPHYPFSGGYASTAVSATSEAGVFEFSLQTASGSVQSGYSTLTGTIDVGPPPFGRTIQGTTLSDILIGDAGDNLFFGNGQPASNFFISTYTPDIYDGGAGTDTVSFANATAPIAASLAEGTSPTQFYSIENIIGSAFSDTIAGNDFANRLEGGAGDDVIATGRGGDTVIGGVGTDTVIYSDSIGTVVVNLTLGRGFNNYADGDTYDGIENISGSFFDDILIGDEGPNEIRGQAGNDLLIGALGGDVILGDDGIDTIEFSDSIGTVFINLTLGRGYNNSAEGDLYFDVENVNGSRFNDFIIGNAGVNRLDGGEGNDTLIGALGADVLIGGAGSDIASYEDNQGAVFVNLASGQGFGNAAQGDTYQGIENVTGSIYNDYLIGDSAANVLTGGAGDDILIGGLGADTLAGGAGFDTASYEDNWGAVFVNLLTGAGASNAAQGDGFDSIEGLVGSVFYDTFIGNDVRNVLNGKRGADTLTGNGGNDDFVFDTPIEGQINVDHITDFTPGQDRIVLDNAVFFTLSDGALQANNLVFGTEATGGQNRIVYDQASGRLWFDDDGNGTDLAVLFAVLDNRPALTSADFFVV